MTVAGGYRRHQDLALHRRDKTGLPAAQRTSCPDGAQHMTDNSACTAYPRTTEGERYAGATPHRPGPARSIHPRRQRDSARDSGKFFDRLETTDAEVVQLCGADRVVISSSQEGADQIRDLEYVLDVEPYTPS